MPQSPEESIASEDSITASWEAVAEWYHAYLTGTLLATVTRRGAGDAAELVFRIFRRHHLERFLPGLQKLGLTGLPSAVAAAQYHYLSNAIGGVSVEYMYESDRKAWIRYPPPRWIWRGTAICGVPGEVSRAMLRGWHAHNGVSLRNPRLGFVCTKQTVDGEPGLEGYYCEHDHELAPEDRLRFARHEDAPAFDPAKAPVLPTADWPPERLHKARRNYAIEFVRTLIAEALQLFGPEQGVALLGLTGRLVGMQFYHETAAALGLPRSDTPDAFSAFLVKLAQAQGDRVELIRDGLVPVVHQSSWVLMRGMRDLHPAAFAAWNSLLEGAVMAHNRHLELAVTGRLDLGDPAFEWRIARRRSVQTVGR